MPNNPQNTLGLTALKFYGKMRSVRLEALSWLKIVDKDGNIARTTTIPSFHKSQLMDYITIDIIHPTVTIPLSPKLPFKQMTHINMLTDLDKQGDNKKKLQHANKNNDNPIKSDFTYATKVMVMSTLYPPKVNLTFTKHEDTDWTILHRRFDHISDIKLATMCQKQLLEGLSNKFPTQSFISFISSSLFSKLLAASSKNSLLVVSGTEAPASTMPPGIAHSPLSRRFMATNSRLF